LNILLIGIDNLPYYVSKKFNPNSNYNTIILDSIAEQSSCFHNFRLPSPNAGLNLNYIINHFDKHEEEIPLHFIEGNPKDHFDEIKKDVKKKDYFVFYRIKNEDSIMNDHESSLIRVENQLKSLIDFWDENKYLTSKTIMIVMGLSGFGRGDHSYKICDKEALGLYDENIHVPLLISHNNPKNIDCLNSISLEMLLNQLILWRNDKYQVGTIDDILKNKKNASSIREDIYSSYKNICSLRGPMFQYFVRFDNSGKQLAHELYDLNNDYEMKNDLTSKLHTINTQIVDLANVYKKRLWDKFKDILF
jgi:hypothetical protein